MKYPPPIHVEARVGGHTGTERMEASITQADAILRGHVAGRGRQRQSVGCGRLDSLPATSAVSAMRRRLAAILSADVAGYSRLMAYDEAATVEILTTHRAVVAGLVTGHNGRVVDSPGDNMLVEFPSVVEAVECAVKIQTALTERNERLPEHRRMRFRVGINVGDILAEGERIYGDGVNVAARIEALADPGGICLSGSAHDQVKGKLDFALEALGERVLKNLAAPVRVYRVHFGAAPAVASSPRTQPEPVTSGRPSIAILPFTNMSGDPEQEHFADEMTEDLISALSKFRELLVIARHSVFSYKARLVAIPTVARELGVRYVLEGSTRKVGTRVRVTAQLIDGLTGGHLWAERYDRDLSDIFAIQDELTRRIATELEVALSSGEQARVWQRSTSSVEAYEHMLRGREQLRAGTSEANTMARQCFERAVDADPHFAFALALLGWTHWADARANWSRSPADSLARAAALADKALALDAGQADAWALRGMVCLIQQRYEEAVTAAERAIAEGANAAGPVMWAGHIFTFCGRPEAGLAMLQKVSRLSPLPPPHYFIVLGNCYRVLGRNEEALDAYRRGLQEAPHAVHGLVSMALVLARAGRDAEARAAIMETLRLQPDFTRGTWSRVACSDRATNQRDLDELERLGLG